MHPTCAAEIGRERAPRHVFGSKRGFSKKSTCRSLLYFLLACVLGTAGANAAKEALLIANADYAHFGKLPNPIPDARQLADVLRQIGFNVNLVENASREGMLDALDIFEERLKASKGIAFFHYGGHGVQVDGKNFLIPADADIPDEKRVATRAVDVDEVMGALDASGSSVNVVVLDACRDNPLPATSTRSATRGLSVVAQKPKNSIIIYAAEAGNKAQDGLFTPTLAKALSVPGRPISEVMTDVRREVYEKSGGSQTPGEYNQLFDQISLHGDASAMNIAERRSEATPSLANTNEGELRRINAELAEIKSALANKDPDGPSALIATEVWLFPDSDRRLLTPQELANLSADQLWRARNEIFARRGLIFQSAKGRALVASLGSSYSPVTANQDSVIRLMNNVEKANVRAIEALEKSR